MLTWLKWWARGWGSFREGTGSEFLLAESEIQGSKFGGRDRGKAAGSPRCPHPPRYKYHFTFHRSGTDARTGTTPSRTPATGKPTGQPPCGGTTGFCEQEPTRRNLRAVVYTRRSPAASSDYGTHYVLKLREQWLRAKSRVQLRRNFWTFGGSI